MALVVLPEGQQRSGKQGGIVWSRNRYGAYVRARSVPVNPNTERQNLVRTNVRNLAIAWNTELTEAQREGWRAYAAAVPWINRLGQPTFLTGQVHYVRSNSARLQAALSRVDDAPTTLNLADGESALNPTWSDPDISIGFDDTADWCSEDGAALICYQGIALNPTRNFYAGPWRFLGAIPGNAATPPTSPQTFSPVYPVTGSNKVFVYVRIARADGRLSQRAQAFFLAS